MVECLQNGGEMDINTRIRNLSVPEGRVDVVLDTDAYNEIDDQFAITYLLSYAERLNIRAVYAAPFFNEKSDGPKDGMQKSYEEILKILTLAGRKVPVCKGSESYLAGEKEPVLSPAANHLVRLAGEYSPQRPLYVVAIGAITNVASALLLAPEIAENIVIVWLGGHARHYHDTAEFNMMQDVKAARVVMKSGAPFVQLPCAGVVDGFTISGPELEYWLKGKNPLADYLAENTIQEAQKYASGTAWTRCIWDVTAVAWLVNVNNRFMLSRLVPTYLPSDDNFYMVNDNAPLHRYVYSIKRDALMTDLMKRIADFSLS